MMPRKPESVPSANAETADATGMPNTMHDDHERRDDAEECGPRRRDAQVRVALRVPVAMQGDEVEQRQDRDRGNQRGQEHVAQRVVGLVVHSAFGWVGR